MTGKTHQIIGITSGMAIFLLAKEPTYQPATLAGVLVLTSIGSLLPDIDQPAASIWNKLPFGSVVGEALNPFLSHRNLTHSFLGFGIISFFAYKLLYSAPVYWELHTHVLLITFLTAYASHLLADMVTVQGIPLFFPNGHMLGIPPYPFEGIRIITGGWFENLIVFPIVNAAFISLVISKWNAIQHILFK